MTENQTELFDRKFLAREMRSIHIGILPIVYLPGSPGNGTGARDRDGFPEGTAVRNWLNSNTPIGELEEKWLLADRDSRRGQRCFAVAV